ncbi:hypothetical protein [Geobacter sulfurreducens]|uniref:hypothetical protein n=1 Tax=Geobacter sulfurreducens TaxID=35554 RepID=UPI002D172234|nr:hypothetical protein [Geobacter sulfurreducens]HML79349.1 hypothetical protein [Geobacter sulfurreducens]
MERIQDYLSKTESATRKLFDGVESYLKILRKVKAPVFVHDYVGEAEGTRLFEEWAKKNEKWLQAYAQSQNEYIDQIFAQATLCGAILQIAAMGIRKFSSNSSIPEELEGIPKINSARKFCIGRIVNDTPIGLIIYAGRNQFNHMDDDEVREPTRAIFKRFGQIGPSRFVKTPYQDPAFDLDNPKIMNFSSNVTALLDWRTYEAFEADMIAMLDNREVSP